MHDARVVEPEDDACRRWGKRGQRWHALDKLGHVVGEARVTELDRYHYTNCDELTLRTMNGRHGAGIFVRGRYRALALKEWSPPMSALTAWIAARDAKVRRGPLSNLRKDLPIDRRIIAFRTPRGARHAVVGRRALSILRLHGKRWIEEHRDLPSPGHQNPSVECYMPIAILDMDGDGSFEVCTDVAPPSPPRPSLTVPQLVAVVAHPSNGRAAIPHRLESTVPIVRHSSRTSRAVAPPKSS